MGIDFLESLAPISYGDVPSLSPPVDRIMPNEGVVIIPPHHRKTPGGVFTINNLIGRGLIQI